MPAALIAMALAGCGGGSHSSSTAAADINGAPVQGATTTGSTTTAGGTVSTTTSTAATSTVPAGGGQAPGVSGGGASGSGSQGTPNNPVTSHGGGKTTHSRTHKASGHAGSSGGSGASGSGSGASGGPGAPSANQGVPFEVSTTSMEPTYKPETTVYYDPTRTHPQIGDVILFHLPAGAEGGACAEVPVGGTPCRDPVPGLLKKIGIKRIVGLPGDTIAVREGHVIRNGQPEPEPQTLPCGKVEQTACEYPKAITVPDGHYYVMADYRSAAKEDSRVFGAVPQEAVLGTVEGG